MTDFARQLSAIPQVRIHSDAPLRDATSFRIGGPAEFMVEALSAEAVGQVIHLCRSEGVPCHVMGHGTNLLAADGGVKGVVLRLVGAMAAQESVEREGGFLSIRTGAGTPLAKLVSLARDAGAVGYAILAGIPGTVGGAIAMNAGTRQGAVSDVLVSAVLVSGDKSVELSADKLGFAYRTAKLPLGSVVVSAVFRFPLGSEDQRREEAEKFQALLKRRGETQPKQPSAGCTFANPDGNAAGALIDAAGLKGAAHGGARISPVHANFTVNESGASAADVLALMNLAQAKVMEATGVSLVPEVRLLGDFSGESIPLFSRFSPDLAAPSAGAIARD